MIVYCFFRFELFLAWRLLTSTNPEISISRSKLERRGGFTLWQLTFRAHVRMFKLVLLAFQFLVVGVHCGLGISTSGLGISTSGLGVGTSYLYGRGHEHVREYTGAENDFSKATMPRVVEFYSPTCVSIFENDGLFCLKILQVYLDPLTAFSSFSIIVFNSRPYTPCWQKTPKTNTRMLSFLQFLVISIGQSVKSLKSQVTRRFVSIKLELMKAKKSNTHPLSLQRNLPVFSICSPSPRGLYLLL